MTEIIAAVGKALSGTYHVCSDPPDQIPAEWERYVVVTVVPLSSPQQGPHFVYRTVMVDIADAGDLRITQAEYLNFVADCDKAFRPVVTFGGRKIMPGDITSSVADGVAHYIFELTYTDTIDGAFDTAAPDMTDMTIRRA